MRQLYKQTLQTNILDNISSKNGDKRHREFEGIQGDRSAKGELFGLNNLMQHEGVSILHSLRQKFPSQKNQNENENEKKKISKGAKKLAALEGLELIPETEVMVPYIYLF